MQGTTVARGLPPTVPYALTDQDRQMFMRQLVGNMVSNRGGKGRQFPPPTRPRAAATATGAGVAGDDDRKLRHHDPARRDHYHRWHEPRAILACRDLYPAQAGAATPPSPPPGPPHPPR